MCHGPPGRGGLGSSSHPPCPGLLKPVTIRPAAKHHRHRQRSPPNCVAPEWCRPALELQKRRGLKLYAVTKEAIETDKDHVLGRVSPELRTTASKRLSPADVKPTPPATVERPYCAYLLVEGKRDLICKAFMGKERLFHRSAGHFEDLLQHPQTSSIRPITCRLLNLAPILFRDNACGWLHD